MSGTTFRAVAVLGAVATAVWAARRRSLSWGASDAELAAALPGDELLPVADLVATRAVSVAADGADVWPWVAQLGQNRGGFYSYDALENLVGCDIHSVDEVVDAWQRPQVGDPVNLAPPVALTVAVVEPGRALVLQGAVPVGDGAPMPYDFVWAFVVVPGPDGASRLVVRERYAYRARWAAPMVEAVEWVSFLMSQRMLRGIRDRAEKAARSAHV